MATTGTTGATGTTGGVTTGGVGTTVDELLLNNCAEVSTPSLPMLLPWLPLNPTLTEAPAFRAAAQPAPLSV